MKLRSLNSFGGSAVRFSSVRGTMRCAAVVSSIAHFPPLCGMIATITTLDRLQLKLTCRVCVIVDGYQRLSCFSSHCLRHHHNAQRVNYYYWTSDTLRREIYTCDLNTQCNRTKAMYEGTLIWMSTSDARIFVSIWSCDCVRSISNGMVKFWICEQANLFW